MQRQRGQYKAEAKNHGKAERDLVLIGGTFPIFCPLKRCEVGKGLGFHPQSIASLSPLLMRPLF